MVKVKKEWSKAGEFTMCKGRKLKSLKQKKKKKKKKLWFFMYTPQDWAVVFFFFGDVANVAIAI